MVEFSDVAGQKNPHRNNVTYTLYASNNLSKGENKETISTGEKFNQGDSRFIHPKLKTNGVLFTPQKEAILRYKHGQTLWTLCQGLIKSHCDHTLH